MYRRFLLLLIFAASLPAAERYEAILRDGRRITGDRLERARNGPQIERLRGDVLFPQEQSQSLRTFRDLSLRPHLQGSFVELTNGDVLPGRVVAYREPEGLPPQLIVEMKEFVGVGSVAEIAVWENAVRRIGRTSQNAPGKRDAAAAARLRDGRTIVYENRRWSKQGLRLLTEQGVEAVEFSQIETLEFPDRQDPQALLEDGLWLQDPQDRVVRIQTAGGARLSYVRSMATWGYASVGTRKVRRPIPSEQPRLAIRPNWAAETILLEVDQIASQTYHLGQEIPLSLLPAELLSQQNGLSNFSWRRNRNAWGGPLRLEQQQYELGIGVQPQREIAFALPQGAIKFSAIVGIDRGAGARGCVRVEVRREEDSQPLWKSEFLLGDQPPQTIPPLDVSGAKRLVLSTRMAHQNRPPGADPLDIGDCVSWAETWVAIAPEALPNPVDQLKRWIPELSQWELPQEQRRLLSLDPYWNRQQWRYCLRLDKKDAEVRFHQQRKITLKNARLPIEAARTVSGERPRGRVVEYEILLRINGEKYGSTMNGNIRFQQSGAGWSSREWSLGEFVGQAAKVELVIRRPPDSHKLPQLSGLLWKQAQMRPLVENLPPRGEPLLPDVRLEELAPLESWRSPNRRNRLELVSGQISNNARRNALELRGFPCEFGYGAPTGGEIRYRLDPSWKRFVAVLGLVDGWKGAGPYEIWLDDKLHWQSVEPASFTRNSPGLQIDVPLPPGKQQITLRIRGTDCYGAWAYAGFMK